MIIAKEKYKHFDIVFIDESVERHQAYMDRDMNYSGMSYRYRLLLGRENICGDRSAY
jgi:hypothetical protein